MVVLREKPSICVYMCDGGNARLTAGIHGAVQTPSYPYSQDAPRKPGSESHSTSSMLIRSRSRSAGSGGRRRRRVCTVLLAGGKGNGAGSASRCI